MKIQHTYPLIFFGLLKTKGHALAKIKRFIWAALLCVLSSSLSLQAEPKLSNAIGQVIFAIGEVHRVDRVGYQQALQKGDLIEVGDTLSTDASGHIHIRLIDEAFVSVRPHSRMQIEQYTYDPSQADKNRVKFTLIQGTGRWITGKAGQAAKQHFRVNTPVAAIGVRGTDFVVQTSDQVSRVAVYQGAVHASSFDGQCQAQSLGACSGSLGRDLTGSLSQRYLEIRPQAVANVIDSKDGVAGKIFAPAAPQEPAVGQRTSNDKLPDGMVGSNAIMWGRWSAQLGVPSGYMLIAKNDSFALYRNLDEVHLPTTGNVVFNLSASEAYSRNSDGHLVPAAVSDASLKVNFGLMQYATAFKWQQGEHVESLYSRGTVLSNGRLLVNRAQSNVGIAGALSASGDEAAYLFLKRMPGDDLYGALHWRR